LTDDTHIVDDFDDRCATVIEYWYFVTTDFNHHIIDAAVTYCAQQVFDGTDGDAMHVTEHGTQARIDDVFP
jgi:hypothetical protein